MDLNDALAIHIYMEHNTLRAVWNQDICREAWLTICRHAEKAMERQAAADGQSDKMTEMIEFLRNCRCFACRDDQPMNHRIIAFEINRVWNAALEAAAMDCERMALALRSANGDGDSWVWPAAQRMSEEAEHIRRLKRKPPEA